MTSTCQCLGKLEKEKFEFVSAGLELALEQSESLSEQHLRPHHPVDQNVESRWAGTPCDRSGRENWQQSRPLDKRTLYFNGTFHRS